MQTQNDLLKKLLRLIQKRTEEMQKMYKPLKTFSILAAYLNIIGASLVLAEIFYNKSFGRIIDLVVPLGAFFSVFWMVFVLNYMYVFKGGLDLWKIIANELEWGKSRKKYLYEEDDNRTKTLSEFYKCGNYRFAPINRGRYRQLFIFYINIISLLILMERDLIQEFVNSNL